MSNNKADEQFSGTKEVEEKHRFDVAKLETYMQQHVEGFSGPLQVSQFKGGQSNPTYKLETPAQNYVLRRKPPGKLLPSAHAVDREFRVLSALHGTGFPVAKPYALCEDESITGTMFFIMELVPGRVFWDQSMPDLEREERRAIYLSMNETLAKLHSYDVEALGLTDFGRPGNYIARQIGRWSKQYKASETRNIDAMNRLMEWLPENNPSDDTNVLVHGDFGVHNILFHPTEPKVAAVLDWELSTLGHPFGDLTYNMFGWYAPKFEGGMSTLNGLDLEALGIPSQEEYVELYCQNAGLKDVPNMAYYRSFIMFRSACIYQGIIGRVRDGTASNPHAMELDARIEPLAEAAWQEAQHAGAGK